jgi:hypothetical protein
MTDLLGLWSFSLNFCLRNKTSSLIFGQLQKPSLPLFYSLFWTIFEVYAESFRLRLFR